MTVTTAITQQRKHFTGVLRQKKDVLAALLPTGIEPARFMQIAYRCVATNDRILECNTDSIINAVSEGAQLGLSFDRVLGQAFIVPYGKTAEFQIGYRGLIQLAYRSGRITKIYALVVHKDDEFEVVDGTEQKIIHKRNMKVDRSKEAEWIGAYAVAVTKEGVTFSTFLSASQVMKRKSRSKAKDSDYSPWNTDPEEMWKKTAIRDLSKVLPVSPETEQALQAAIADEYRDAGVETPSMPELPAGAIEVEAQAVPEANENRVIHAAFDGDTAYIVDMPAKLREQAKLKDFATEMKSRKRWEMPAAGLADFAEFAYSFGYEVKEAKTEVTEAEKKDWDIGI